MHLYWRVIEELKLIGETWAFSDPGLKRSYERWVKKNAGSLALISSSEKTNNSPLINYRGGIVCMN